MDAWGVIRLAGGLILLAFLPGWAWSRVFVPRARGLERFALSVGLSVALVVLAIYLGNVALGVRLDAVSAILWAALLTLAGWAAGGLRRRPVSP